MAPTTRNQRKRASEAPVTVSAPSPAPTKKSSGHITFGSDDEDDEDDEHVVNAALPDGGVSLTGAAVDENDSEESDDDDDEAPEAVTMGSGREAVKKKEEDAKKAIEAQEEAARQKRKRREAKLKEQKETADARKRRKVVDAKPADEKDTPASDEDDATPASTEVVTLPKSKAPALLPTSLLEKITDRPSAPSRSHKRAADFGIIDEDASDDDMDMDGLDDFDFGDDAGMGEEMALMIAEKNRKKRLARKAKMEFKKGPVTVKVLKDEKKLRKIMMPPANKKVANTKESWLNGRGVVKRRAIGGGIRGAFK